MKPNFALSLSFEGIRLLYRAAGGWRVVGDVALDADDLPGALAVLRKTAASLEPGGVRCKLLIPNSQIRYLTIDTGGRSGDALRAAARAALDGATPYDVDELAFDLSPDGERTHIAAVARETLAEAEAFAEEHRFHPVSFVAIPGDAPYLGEPFFGTTEAAAGLLEPGDTVEPDGIAVVVIGEVDISAGPVVETTEAEPVAAETQTPAAPAATAEEKTPEPAQPETPPAPAELPETAGAEPPEPASPVNAAKDTESTKVNSAKRDARTASVELTETAEVPAPEPVFEGHGPARAASPAPATVVSAGGTPDGPPPEAPQPTDPLPAPSPPEDPQPSEPVPTSPPEYPPSRPDEVPPTPTEQRSGRIDGGGIAPLAPLPQIGFASRRATDRTAGAPSLGGARRSALPTGPDSVSASRIAPVPEVAANTTIAPDSSSLTPTPLQKAPDTAPKAGFLTRRRARSGPGAPAGAAVVASIGVITPAPASEAERMTIFGARKGDDVGGKPRFLGLILTAVLLVFLAGVAAWASVFLDDGIALSRLFGDRSPRIAAESAPVEEAAPAQLQPLAAPPEPPRAAPEPDAAPEPLRTVSLDPDLSDEDGAVLDALRAPALPEPAPLTEQEAQARYAVTGIWPRAPVVPEAPAAVPLEDLYVTGIDPVSTSSDAVALPDAATYGSDLTLASVPSPAAAGTDFALDARGLVVPTAAGALTPDGVLVYLGRPAAVPPPTPARLATPPEVDAERIQLAGLRPRARPGDLAETTERAQLDGLTRSELAALRPRLRPQSVQEQAEAPPEAPQTPDISADDAVAAALALPPAVQNATKFAVQSSKRPDTRPSNFARIVKRAEARAPAPTQVASTASVAPRTVAPSIPSKASVAQQATVKNAIRLNQVNLIGVYGKPSSRRALVRLGNGRYQKVVVGDRIDGGRVSAIGDSELRYTRRGRDVVLRMPSG